MPPRTSQSNQQARTAARQCMSKPMLLPMPRQDSDRLSLQNHLVLSALEAHQGSASRLPILLQMVMLTSVIDDARSNEIRPEALVAAEQSINEAFFRGQETDQWYLHGRPLELCRALSTWHDRQLRTAPLHIIEKPSSDWRDLGRATCQSSTPIAESHQSILTPHWTHIASW